MSLSTHPFLEILKWYFDNNECGVSFFWSRYVCTAKLKPKYVNMYVGVVCVCVESNKYIQVR